jgi:hypothetical protein
MNNDFAIGLAENLPQALVEFQFVGGKVKAGGLRLPRISFLF